MPCYAIEDVVPIVDPTAYVHPSAVLIGDVTVGPRCYVGPCASLRGDFGRIVIKTGANIQDSCVLHGFPNQDTVVEENGHIGHGAIIHSCVIRHDALVGMNAVVMDEADVGAETIIAACTLVPAGMRVPTRSLAAGLPAKVLRQLRDDEISWKRDGTLMYQNLAERCLNSMREILPLTHMEANRPKLRVTQFDSLIATKRRYAHHD